MENATSRRREQLRQDMWTTPIAQIKERLKTANEADREEILDALASITKEIGNRQAKLRWA